LRNNRVSIGEDRGNFQVIETIAKYPAGAIVMVYYNPLHPHEAVLERDLPQGLGVASASERRSSSRWCSARRSACTG
jgi:hypothetical protein